MDENNSKRKRGCRGGRGKQRLNTSATMSPQLSSPGDLKIAQDRASLWRQMKQEAEQKTQKAAMREAQDFRNRFFGARLPKPKPSKTPNVGSAQAKPR